MLKRVGLGTVGGCGGHGFIYGLADTIVCSSRDQEYNIFLYSYLHDHCACVSTLYTTYKCQHFNHSDHSIKNLSIFVSEYP